MAENMRCKIVSVQGVVFEGEVRSVRAPASEGEVCILKDHIPFVTSLKAGALTLDGPEGGRTFTLKAGVHGGSARGRRSDGRSVDPSGDQPGEADRSESILAASEGREKSEAGVLEVVQNRVTVVTPAVE